MKKKAARKASAAVAGAKKPGMVLAVVALLVNALLLPGLGTIIGGMFRDGLVQLFALFVGGSLVTIIGFFTLLASPVAGILLIVLGMLLALAGWVWAIISGIVLIRRAS